MIWKHEVKILINQASFSLPARSFNIDFAVMEKRQLPIVKEFVVRFIYSLEKCRPEVISSFFGFKSSEMIDVIEDLDTEGLIAWKDEEVELTTYALERFDNVKGSKIPRFFQITDKDAKIIFDLFLFKILPKAIESKNISLSIDVPMPDKSNSKLIENIKTAFDNQFTNYQESINVDAYDGSIDSLYKINSIQDDFDLIIPLDINYYIDTETQYIINKYDLDLIHEWDSERKLFNTIDDVLVRKTPKEQDIGNDTSTYLTNTLDPFYVDIYTGNDKNDGYQVTLDELLNYYTQGTKKTDLKDYQMIVGNLYTKDNIQIIQKIITQIVGKNKEKLLPGALWFTNLDNKTWGRTSSLINIVSIINKIFDKRNKNAALVINTFAPNEDETFKLSKIFDSSNAKFQSCSNIFGSNQIEILLIPDVLVAASFHFEVMELRELTVPIGFITSDKDKIEEITKKIRKWSLESNTNFSPHFEKKGALVGETLFIKTVAPVLEFYEDKKKNERKNKELDKK